MSDELNRAAPVAQLDADLPPPAGVLEVGIAGSQMTAKVLGYTGEQMHNFAGRYVERIRHLEREAGLLSMVVESLKTRCASADELIESMATKADRRALRPAQSIGDDETFLDLLAEYLDHDSSIGPSYDPEEAKRALIAYIDGRTAPPAASDASWGSVETVGDMVRNLLTLDQSDPIHAAFHVDIEGKRRCRTRPLTISRERVIEGKWVDPSRKDVPYAIIVWAKQDERIDGRTAGTASEAAPETEAAHASREWQPVTRAGQVKCGDKLRFKIGDKAYSETARIILDKGTDKEEVVYNKSRNYYFITSMVINGSSNHKCVEVRAAAPSTQEGANGN